MNYQPPRRSDGTIQSTRIKLPWPKDRLFRVLSIDGGGIKGIFPASYLAEIERRFLDGQSVRNYFDMIAGTSTGGIIALALANGMTARDATGIYVERGEAIFPDKGSGLRAKFRWFRAPKHDQNALKDELLKVFGECLIDDAKIRLIIPSFEGRYSEPYIYKTPHHPDYKRDRHVKTAHVALHTSAAPSIYPGVENDGHIMIDGGIWANNPIMNALVDVLACFDVPPENVRILSIGTGDDVLSADEGLRKGGLGRWIFPSHGNAPMIFRTAARAQSLNALGQSYLLIGKQNVVRVEPPESENPIALDDVARATAELPRLARAHGEATGHYVNTMFLQDHADPFVKCAM
ncbi:CBASS cGAMP-activated phospholipase [Mesorhizobium sp.]|uniref:CBASS cGAMP-activated phospholipase n=1 Tax=Mesorhizobium sp. TaxID=1871066 RepID=UPI001214D651|nr:CBASS cGAMP-activated phospholipase [Mesorhizobium sp.]TJV17985.1 MAG: patatin [Mesorhizobium sp.]